MDSNLLKEAIADAKAVRQTALANAKAALEEAFGTRLEAMFAPKLDEETADAIPAAAPATAPAAAPALAQEDAVNETDIEEIIRELESELPQGQAGMAPEAPMAPEAGMAPAAPMAPAMPPAPAPEPAPMAPAAPVPPADPAAMAPAAPAPAPTAEEEMDEEIDVNELLEALKKEEEDEEDMEKLDESVPVKTSGIGSSDNKEPSADAHESSHIESSGQSVDSATVGTPDYEKKSSKDATVGAKRPNMGKNATKTNLSTPGGPLKENTGGSTPGYPEGAKKTSSGDDATEGVDRPNQADHATKDDLSTVPSPLKEENDTLKAQLSEAEQAITYLRTQLNEINLLNAKLLYTNRLFKEFTMDNQKKMKIVEMFDRAKNVREVKMTYTVVAESLNFGGDRKKSSKVQSITEGMASKPVAGTAPNKQIIAESAKSEMVSKFQKLAGIKAPVIQPNK